VEGSRGTVDTDGGPTAARPVADDRNVTRATIRDDDVRSSRRIAIPQQPLALTVVIVEGSRGTTDTDRGPTAARPVADDRTVTRATIRDDYVRSSRRIAIPLLPFAPLGLVVEGSRGTVDTDGGPTAARPVADNRNVTRATIRDDDVRSSRPFRVPKQPLVL